MGKSIALAMPFIIFLLLVAFWSVYKAGKRMGTAPQRDALKEKMLLRRADEIFVDLLYVDDAEVDDILTAKTQELVKNWRKNYGSVMHK